MKLLKNIIISILLIFILSINLLSYEEEIIKIENDTIRQNEKIKIKIRKENYKIYDNLNDLFAAFLFYVKTDNRFVIYEIKKNDSIDNEYIYFSKLVPINSAVCIVDICHKDNGFSLQRTSNLIVYNKDNSYSEGSLNELIIDNADSSNYLNYFNLDRRLYPNNFNIFASKWMFELKNNLFSANQLEKDLINIDNSDYTKEQKIILSFVGQSYATKSLDSLGLKNILNIKNSDNLNYEILVILIDEIFRKFLNDDDLANAIKNVCLNNPDSKYTHIKIINGELLPIMSKDELANLLEILYNKYNNDPQWMIKYAYTIAKKNPEKSLEICQEIINRLKTNDMTKHLSMSNDIVRYRGTVVAAISEYAMSKKMYEKGLSMIKEFDKYYDEADKNSTSFYYYSKANLYRFISLDSAYLYYAKAYRLFPQMKKIRNAFSEIVLEKLNIQANEQILDSLSAQSSSTTINKIPKEFPILRLSDNTSININKYKKPIIIIRSYAGCAPCKKELELLFSIDFDPNKKPLILFTDNEHYKSMKRNNKIPKIYNVKGIKNGVEINNILNLNASPNLVLIENDNILLRINGYNPNDKDIIEKSLQK